MINNPVNPGQLWRIHLSLAQESPRCHALTKRKTRCLAPAIKGRPRCRLHGGKGGAPRGERHGRFLHGMRTIEAIEQRRMTTALIREFRRNLAMLDAGDSVT